MDKDKTTSEIDILLSLYVELNTHLESFKNSRDKITTIMKSIKQIDNNYFDTQCNNDFFTYFVNVFNDDESVEETISNLESLKLYIRDKIKNRCIHEWTDDTIDIDVDMSQEICYCVKCAITKR